VDLVPVPTVVVLFPDRGFQRVERLFFCPFDGLLTLFLFLFDLLIADLLSVYDEKLIAFAQNLIVVNFSHNIDGIDEA